MKTIILFALLFVCVTCDFSKIKYDVSREFTKTKKSVNVMILLQDQVKFSELKSKSGKSVYQMADIPRGRLVVTHLQQKAKITQKNIKTFLTQNNVRFEAFWVSNCIAAYGITMDLLIKLSNFREIKEIASNEIQINDLETKNNPTQKNQLNFINTKETPDTILWSIKFINTDKLWEKGFEGQGIVVGITDTGVEYKHPALVSNYRGNKGNSGFSHDYNWYDAQTQRREPFDNNGHGTHCTGTVAGGVARRIGNAPKSKWIHCKALPGGTDSSYIGCLQFYIAPHDLDGKNPNPDIRPHVTSHSYGCVRCSSSEAMRPASEALRAAGVVMVVAAGNAGSRCSSIGDQPGHYEAVVSVGALNRNAHTIARFSSRGPIRLDGSGRRKPDISAPGVSVLSSWPRGTYRSLQGTSMATPGVAGAIATLWSAKPKLVRNIDETLDIIYKTAYGQNTTLCSSRGSPNNVFGYGTLDIYKAYEEATKRGF